MREIIFDTETTGLDARDDRIIEIGGVELVNRFPTGRTFHEYINPEGRKVHAEALAVHGISDAQLVGKPTFGQVSAEFLEFIDGARLVAHNASFDIAFVNAEFARLGIPSVEPGLVVDTLMLARRKHPMGPNSLDALCRRYGIDNSRRTKHGALLDSELLAEVYIELVGGKQAALGLEIVVEQTPSRVQVEGIAVVIEARPRPLAQRLSDEELAAHAAMIAGIGEKAIWNRFGSDNAS
ncbi:DNA polymerase-3 subunit epsilon [Mesorhizobium albiziae]|uniref:DNA polymerase III subunit epsilon n=1 Tax=Neomesorhizobium albiziae TaxID=335020 RepID=A0A1I3Y570_9HYPH|nr:DNA polymerase III subunit epsilon [Mesorhizobium albiziae]GLS30084.1 DNA polymerase III subunit epsilon [Mesorhizobium albiziae]SFK26912.1 DNA polymerase-3 subunit epsilon [Mesorhizobium albiziae]